MDKSTNNHLSSIEFDVMFRTSINAGGVLEILYII